MAGEAGNNWQDKPGSSPDFWEGGVPPPISLLSAAPLHSKSEPLWRLWDSAPQGEVVSCFKSYITSWWCFSPKLFCKVVDEINRTKNTTGFYRVDELVSLFQFYTVGGPNLTSVSGTGGVFWYLAVPAAYKSNTLILISFSEPYKIVNKENMKKWKIMAYIYCPGNHRNHKEVKFYCKCENRIIAEKIKQVSRVHSKFRV